jgi:hypothetical protein
MDLKFYIIIDSEKYNKQLDKLIEVLKELRITDETSSIGLNMKHLNTEVI